MLTRRERPSLPVARVSGTSEGGELERALLSPGWQPLGVFDDDSLLVDRQGHRVVSIGSCSGTTAWCCCFVAVGDDGAGGEIAQSLELAVCNNIETMPQP